MEVCPRISAQDLLHICEINDSNSAGLKPSAANKRKSKPRGLIVDIRSTDEYPLEQIVTVRGGNRCFGRIC